MKAVLSTKTQLEPYCTKPAALVGASEKPYPKHIWLPLPHLCRCQGLRSVSRRGAAGWPCSAGRPESTIPEGECCLREGCLQPRSRPLPFPLCGEACAPHSAPCTECAVTTPACNLSRPLQSRAGGNQHCKASCQPWPRQPQGEQLAGAGGPPETALPSSFRRKQGVT